MSFEIDLSKFLDIGIKISQILEPANEKVIIRFEHTNGSFKVDLKMKDTFFKKFKETLSGETGSKGMRYKSKDDLYQAVCDFNRENAISGSERAVYRALSKLDRDHSFQLYLSLQKFIDHFLF